MGVRSSPNATFALNTGLPHQVADDLRVFKSEVDAALRIASGDFYNVQDSLYGAVGDGVADDLAAINDAIVAAFDGGGGLVFLPHDDYKTTGPIILKEGVDLWGPGATILPATIGQSVFQLHYAVETMAKITISELTIDAGAVTGIKAVDLRLAHKVTLNSLHFLGVDHTLYGDRIKYLNFNESISEGNPSQAAGTLEITDTTDLVYSQNNNITNYTVKNIGNGVKGQAILLHRATNTAITNLQSNDLWQGPPSADGIIIEDDCQGTKIIGGTIAKPTYGVKVRIGSSGAFPTFTDLIDVDIDQAQTTAVAFDQGYAATITGGNFTNSLGNVVSIGFGGVTVNGAVIDVGLIGIVVNANIQNFHITKNRIFNQSSAAILLSAGASNNFTIEGNDLSLGNGAGIGDLGTTGINKFIANNPGSTLNIITGTFRLAFNNTNYANLDVGATGNLTVAPTGGMITLSSPTTDAIFKIQTGSAVQDAQLSIDRFVDTRRSIVVHSTAGVTTWVSGLLRNPGLSSSVYGIGTGSDLSTAKFTIDPTGNIMFIPTSGVVGMDGVANPRFQLNNATAEKGLFALATTIGAHSDISIVNDTIVRGRGNLILEARGAGNIYLTTGNPDTAKVTILGDGTQMSLASTVRLQSSNYASQTTGWGISGSGDADFRHLYVDQVQSKSFITDLEQALAGGQIISKSVAELASDFTLPAAGGAGTLVLKDLPSATGMAVFQSGDIVRLRQFSRASGNLTIADAWGVVTSFVDNGNGTQNWTFTRSTGAQAGTASGTISAKTLALDYGVTGNGIHEVNAIDGTYGVNSPYSQVVTWATHPQNGQTVRTRMGNLLGITAAAEYGLYAGNGFGATNKYLRISDVNFEIHNIALQLYDGATLAMSLQPSGPYFALGNPMPITFLQASTEGIWMGNVGSSVYSMRVGVTDGAGVLTAGWKWDGVTNVATFIGDGTFSGALSAASGTFAGSLTAVTGTIGSVTAASGNVLLNASGLTVFGANFKLQNAEVSAATFFSTANAAGGIATYTQNITTSGSSDSRILFKAEDQNLNLLNFQMYSRPLVNGGCDLRLWGDEAIAGFTIGADAAPTAMLDVRGTGIFTGNLAVKNTAPVFILHDTTASAKYPYFAVDSNFLYIREQAAANGSLLNFDLANNNVGLGVVAFGTSATNTLSLLSGTAPTTGPADTVQFYSSDDAAGHTIPSFFCEGTNVVATGQADSVSSVRVKMRINGVVRTFLCI